MISKRLKIISDLTEELNVLRENYQDMIENDPKFAEFEEISEQMKLERKEKREQVRRNESYMEAEVEIKEKRRDIKENKEALSVELVELYKKEGKTEVVDHEGNPKKMKFSVKLVNL